MWLSHKYGPHVHILQTPLTQLWLGELCRQETKQPRLNQLVENLYRELIRVAVDHLLPREHIRYATRMASQHPTAAQVEAEVIAHNTRAIVVNLARAGTWPSHICYHFLNEILNPDLVRQDHIFAARKSNSLHQVTNTELGAHKIGGDKEAAWILFPDPMGATGHTITAAVEHYLNHITGQATRWIALHLIVTPEYLRRIARLPVPVEILALRVDRGLSPQHVLTSTPGEFWDLEKGLNDRDYIVPGAGGLGELLNNSYV
jgi:uracil phosphoribosyltransferase